MEFQVQTLVIPKWIVTTEEEYVMGLLHLRNGIILLLIIPQSVIAGLFFYK